MRGCVGVGDLSSSAWAGCSAWMESSREPCPLCAEQPLEGNEDRLSTCVRWTVTVRHCSWESWESSGCSGTVTSLKWTCQPGPGPQAGVAHPALPPHMPLFIYLFNYPLVHPSVHPLIHPPIYTSIHPSVYPSIYLSIHPTVSLPAVCYCSRTGQPQLCAHLSSPCTSCWNSGFSPFGHCNVGTGQPWR